MSCQTYLTLVVMLEANVVEVLENFLRIAILLDGTITIETDHIRRRHSSAELELGYEPLLYSMCQLLGGHIDDKMDMTARVMLLVILYGPKNQRPRFVFTATIRTEMNRSGTLVFFSLSLSLSLSLSFSTGAPPIMHDSRNSL